METQALSPIVSAAFAKLVSGLVDRDALPVGKHRVDTTVSVRLQATVSVGEDYDQRVVQAAKPWALVAQLVRELGLAYSALGREGIDLASIVEEAEKSGEDEKLTAEISSIVAGMKSETWRSCKGKVVVKGAALIESVV